MSRLKHRIMLPKVVKYVTDVDPRVQWCKENIGRGNWNAAGWHDVKFVFRYQKDAVFFALKWT